MHRSVAWTKGHGWSVEVEVGGGAHVGAYLDGDAERRQRVDEGSGPEGEVIGVIGVGHRSEISKNFRDLIRLPLALGLAHEINPFANERLRREARHERAHNVRREAWAQTWEREEGAPLAVAP